MDANTEFLEYIYQNSEMGKNTMKDLIDINEDVEFSKCLAKQQSEYVEFNGEAVKLLATLNKEPKSIGTIKNFKSYIMIKANTLMDKTPSHMAEMLIQGSTMGIIDIKKRLNDYKDVKPEIIALGKKLLDKEEKNVEELKKFL